MFRQLAAVLSTNTPAGGGLEVAWLVLPNGGRKAFDPQVVADRSVAELIVLAMPEIPVSMIAATCDGRSVPLSTVWSSLPDAGKCTVRCCFLVSCKDTA